MAFQEESDLIIVEESEAGERLDKILARRFDGIQSRSYFQMLIEEEQILLNGSPAKKRLKPSVGDEIQIHFILTPEIGLTPEAIPLDILYEDDHILAINKPAGMVVHPAVGNWSGTFVNALLYYCQQKGSFLPESGALRPGIVHRLDKDTSGVLLAAKTASAQQGLVNLFSSRKVHKEYLAICIGNPGNLEMSAAIGRHPVHRRLMTVVETGGKSALTLCKTLAHNNFFSLVHLVLATGRTHQIRVHLKHQGTPILGDSTYGSTTSNTKFGVERQLLHAERVSFIHPITNQFLEIIAPQPLDFTHWRERILSPR